MQSPMRVEKEVVMITFCFALHASQSADERTNTFIHLACFVVVRDINLIRVLLLYSIFF